MNELDTLLRQQVAAIQRLRAAEEHEKLAIEQLRDAEHQANIANEAVQAFLAARTEAIAENLCSDPFAQDMDSARGQARFHAGIWES
jgi:hypothetical protein